jgi:hypothetical protein
MNNSVFGKTMENLRKRVVVKLVRSSEEDRLRKLIAKPNYARCKIFDDDLAALHMHKTSLCLNRPIYVGMSILDLSKLLMYDFSYNKVKNKNGDRATLLYTDTDSLLMHIETEDIYTDITADPNEYDTSDYPDDHPLHSTRNKNVLGKMKDKCARVPVAEFVGLRPKMYSILKSDSKELKKAASLRKILKYHLLHGSRQPVSDPLGKVVSNLNGPVVNSRSRFYTGWFRNSLPLSVMRSWILLCADTFTSLPIKIIASKPSFTATLFFRLSGSANAILVNVSTQRSIQWNEPLVLTAIIANVKNICKPEAVLAVGHNVTMDAVTCLLMKLVGLLLPHKAVYIHEPDVNPFFSKDEVEFVGRRVAMLTPSCRQ